MKVKEILPVWVDPNISHGEYRELFDEIRMGPPVFQTMAHCYRGDPFSLQVHLFSPDNRIVTEQGPDGAFSEAVALSEFRFLRPYELLSLQKRYPNAQRTMPITTQELLLGATLHMLEGRDRGSVLGPIVALPLELFRYRGFQEFKIALTPKTDVDTERFSREI